VFIKKNVKGMKIVKLTTQMIQSHPASVPANAWRTSLVVAISRKPYMLAAIAK
jgi:hypothetical protein